MTAANTSERIALVTGASSGIGQEFARLLARRGYALVLVARRRERLEALSNELQAAGRASTVIAADLGQPGAAAKLLGELEARRLEPELLVNNAGIGLYGSALEHPPERVEAMLRLNVVALTELALAFGAKMAGRGSGSIINISSTAGLQPDPWLAAYGATKAYVTSFSLALAEELAPRGVRVLTVFPGLTRTEFDSVAGVRAGKNADWMYMSAEQCAAIALRALEKNRRLVIPGRLDRVIAFFARRAPFRLVTRVNAWLLAPKAGPETGSPSGHPPNR
jgi:short-subunit dehydrogenase